MTYRILMNIMIQFTKNNIPARLTCTKLAKFFYSTLFMRSVKNIRFKLIKVKQNSLNVSHLRANFESLGWEFSR